MASSKPQILRQLKRPPNVGKGRFAIVNTSYVDADAKVQINAGIIVDKSKIIAAAPMAKLKASGALRGVSNVIDAQGFIITPGLLNSHTHAALSFLRGLAHSREDVIENLFFTTESNLTPQLIEPLSYGYIYDGLRSGVTWFADHYYFVEGVGRALELFGLRGVLAETLGDKATAFPDSDQSRFRSVQKSINKWPFDAEFIKPILGPHAADTASPAYLKKLADFAKAESLPIHMHLSQTDGEKKRVTKRDGNSPVQTAAKAGLIGENSLLVHLVSASEDDIKLIADKGASIGFCPASQMIYERVAPLEHFAKHDVSLCVATDCAPSNDGADVLSELRLTGLLGQNLKKYSDYFSPEALWAMITTRPAKVFGMDHIGAIAPGKAADLVFVRDDLLNVPNHHPLVNLIYGIGSRNTEHVMVAGKWRLWDRGPTDLDLEKLKTKAAKAAKSMAAHAAKN